MYTMQTTEPTLHLKVGAIVAYECLLDEAAGTTSWRVGAVRALPHHAASAAAAVSSTCYDVPYTAVRDGLHAAKRGRDDSADEDEVVVSSTPPPPQQQQQQQHRAQSVPSMRDTTCHTVLIQPWISLAATPAAPQPPQQQQQQQQQRCDSVNVVAAAGEGAEPHSGSPSPRSQRAVSPAVRFTEMDAMQRELEEIQRFARGGGGGDGIGAESDDAESDEEERLAKTLTQAYTRVLASTASMEGSAAQHEDDGHALSTSRSLQDEDVDPDLTRRIEAKRREFRLRIEHLLAEMKQTRQRQRDLQAAQAGAEASLKDARVQLKEAQEQVQKIDTRALREIQSYRLPPAVVKLVMSAVLCVLGEKAATWPEVVTAMRATGFISRVALFDPAQLSQSRIQELKRHYISDAHFSHEDAVKGSQALGQFHEWVTRQVQLGDADGDLSRFLAQKESSTTELAVTRRKMEADATELKYLEEELDTLLHERVRRQQQHHYHEEHLAKSGSVLRMAEGGHTTTITTTTSTADGAPAATPRWPPLPSVRPLTEAGETSTTQHQQPASSSAPTTPHSFPQKPAVGASDADCASGEQPMPTSTPLCAAAGGGASSTAQTWVESSYGLSAAVEDSATVSAPRPSSAMAQQQQVLPLLPPGAQWACPPAGTVHCTYVLRSSILCVLGYQAIREVEEQADSSAAAATAEDEEEGAVWKLTRAQQHFVCDALRQPLNDRPPAPLTEDEAAAESARHALCTTHHTTFFDGDAWAMVTEDSPAELRRALVEDIAALCQVPHRAVTALTWELGSLRVGYDVEHPATVTSEALQTTLDSGSYPAVIALYKSVQQRKAKWEAAQEQQMRLAEAEEQLREAKDAQAALQHALQATEMNRTAAVERLQEEHAKSMEATREAQDAAAAQLATLQHRLADAERRAADAEERARAAEKQAQADERAHQHASEHAAEQAMAGLTDQLQAAQAALEAQQQQHQKELADAEARAVTSMTDQQSAQTQMLSALQLELADTQQQLRVANDVLKKLEVQSRRDAKETEKRAKDAEKAAQQQRTADTKEAEKATAAVERKLRAAQAALHEQGKLHHAEVVKLLAQLAESETARQQLCSAHLTARAAEQMAVAEAQQRLEDAQRSLVEALTTQLSAMDAAAASCAAATQHHADGHAAAEQRRRERRAAVEGVCRRAKELAQEASTGGDADQEQQQHCHDVKAALARALAALLRDMKKDGAEATTAVAHSRRTAADQQAAVDAATATAATRAAEKAEAGAALRRLQEAAAEGGSGADSGAANPSYTEETAQGEEKAAAAQAVAELHALIAASSQCLTAAGSALSAGEVERLRACAAEAEEVEHRLQSPNCTDSAARCVREVHTLATTSFLQRHQAAWMNTCLCGLLATALVTLQYKKYAV